MTSPIVLPQQPSGFQQGLASFLDAYKMMQQQRYQQQWLQQNQQQMQLQEQAQQMQALRDRMTARNQAQQQFMQLIDTMGMDVMNDPEVMQRVQEAGLDPKGLQRQYEAGQKRQQTERDARIKGFVATLPKEIQQPTTNAIGAVMQGLGMDTADRIWKETMNGLGEEVILKLKVQYPWLKDLPRDKFIEEYGKIVVSKMQKDLGLGEEAERQVRMQQMLDRTNRAMSAGDSLDVIRTLRPLISELNQLGSPLWNQMASDYLQQQAQNPTGGSWMQLSPIERENFFFDRYLGPGFADNYRKHLQNVLRLGLGDAQQSSAMPGSRTGIDNSREAWPSVGGRR